MDSGRGPGLFVWADCSIVALMMLLPLSLCPKEFEDASPRLQALRGSPFLGTSQSLTFLTLPELARVSFSQARPLPEDLLFRINFNLPLAFAAVV